MGVLAVVTSSSAGPRLARLVLVLVVLNAIALAAIWRASRPAPRGVRVLTVSPLSGGKTDPVVSPDAEFRVEFDREIGRPAAFRADTSEGPQRLVAPRDVETTSGPEALLRFEPVLAGTLAWDGPRTLVFRPDSPLPRATRFSLRIEPHVASRRGWTLEGPRHYEFRTAAPRVRSVTQEAYERDGRAVLSVGLDDLVAPTELMRHLELRDGNGAPVLFDLLGEAPAKSLRLRTRQPVDRVVARVSAGLRGLSGPLGSEDAARFDVALRRALRLKRAFSHSVFREAPSVFLRFNNSIDAQSAGRVAQWIRIQPETRFHVSWLNGSNVTLDGDFVPGRSYRVEVLRGLPGRNGSLVVESDARTVRIPDRRPGVRILTEGVISPRGNQRISIATANVDRVELVAHRVLPNNLVHFLADRSWRVDRVARRNPARTLELETEPNRIVESAVELRDLVPDGERIEGLWLLRAETDDFSHRSVLSVSDLGVSAKQGADGIVVWVTRLRDGSPVGRAHVSLWTRNAQMRAFGHTDVDGLARLPGPFDLVDGEPRLLLVEKDESISYLSLASSLSYAAFDVAGQAQIESGYEAFVYTNRGVYRPGDELRVEGLVRGVDVAVPPTLPLTWEIERPDGRIWRTESEILENGFAGASFELDASARTGRWFARLRVPGEGGETLGSVAFRVEDLAPDRLRLQMDLVGPKPQEKGAHPRLRPAQRIAFSVRGELLAGLPAAGERVEVAWRLRSGRVDPRALREDGSLDGFALADDAAVAIRESGRFADLILGPDGQARLDVTVPSVEAAGPLRLEVETLIEDASGRPVRARRSFDVDPQPFHLALRPERSGEWAAGSSAVVECGALGSEGAWIALDEVDLVVERIEISTSYEREANGLHARRVHEERVEIERRRLDLTNAPTRAAVHLDRPGHYRVALLHEPTGLRAAARIRARGDGWEDSSQQESPEHLDISVLSPLVRPGGSARVRIRSPFAGTLLLTLESDRVLFTKVLSMPGSHVEVDVEVPELALGNVFVAASVVRGTDPDRADGRWRAQRAYGVVSMPLDQQDRRFLVELSARPRYVPGEDALLRARVFDASGEPARAQVSLFLIDEGLLARTGEEVPDPFERFYGARRLEVELSDLYGDLASEVSLASPRAKPGGDGPGRELERLSPVSARRFVATALHLGRAETDDEGSVLVATRMPEFSGELRLFAVVDSGASFGCASRAVQVRSPIHLELGLPRFLSPGDRIVSRVDLFNESGAPGDVQARLAIDGPLIAADEPNSTGRAATAPIVGESALAFASLGTDDGSRVLFAGRRLEDGESARQAFELVAESRAGVAHVEVIARLGDQRTVERVELPVRPAAARVGEIRSGRVRSGEPLELVASERFLPGTARHRLVLSASPEIELLGAIEYLVTYPHGCLEQTTSRILPQLYLRDLARALSQPYDDGEGHEGLAEIERNVRQGLARLSSFVTVSGGMSAWPGGTGVWRWATVYAAFAMLEARRAGFAVESRDLDAVLDYLQSGIVGAEPGVRSPTLRERAFAMWVLALAGRTDGLPARVRELHDRLRNQPGGDEDETQFLLGATWLALGDLPAAESILGEAVPDSSAHRQAGGELRSAIRESAILLAVTLEVRPSDPRVAVFVDRLRRARVGGRWGTTQENAFAILALGKYARIVGASREPAIARVFVEDRDPIEVREGGTWSLEEDLSGKRIRVEVDGGGSYGWFFSEGGVPRDGAVEEIDRGLIVRRRYLDESGRDLAGVAIERGTTVEVEITLEAQRSIQNVAVTDLLPAGLEVESPGLARTVGKGDGAGADLLRPDHLDVRDDRVVIYLNQLAAGRGVYRYAARATTEGDFAVGAIAAECLYDEGTRSVHGAGRFRIVARAEAPVGSR